MTITFDKEEKEKIVRGIFENFPEYACCSFRCTRWKYDKFLFDFIDIETGIEYTPTFEQAIRGFDLFMEAYSNKEISFYGFDPQDEGSYDVDVVEAVLQYILLGELVYG